MILRSYINWSEGNDYIGVEVAFPGGSTWKMERKIRKVEVLHTQDDYEELNSLIKIQIQIPLYKTATQGPSEHAKQADPDIPHLASNEIEALTILTQAKCSSSPYLIDSMNRQQTDGWVPGGYIHYIVMEMLPGVTVCD
ncbi:hypothetical protein BO83DRAFT_389639 [Aspergillus eucalypticola CBS 122712]|uniref:Protein kinase domain-containing protein n=1 Tax=Aspergillus eucalypticola (strain CBS 122712 / IBT 29274) TaxID=1448314 RepID=A0A317VEA5_ASPEC|nr:uncharacterized protein BO83DRAFT_389639 [Aspergillus eucalypticola CBS 122712]PWY71338.1 hypothetical protein BO83DRAFT_389639 [Aspergillus eucalypticola CBS 122712]